MAVPEQEALYREFLQAFNRMADGLVAVAQELHRNNLIEMHRLFVDQLDRGMEDPQLADVGSTLADLSDSRRRQMIFANRHYGKILLAYRIGAMERGEVLGALRILSKNSVFAEYWQRTAEQRQKLPDESIEARIGRAVDAIMDERLDDLEEWWVVGTDEESR